MIYIEQIMDAIREVGLDAEYKGKDGLTITAFSSVFNYKENSITWVKNRKAYEKLNGTEETVKLVILDAETYRESSFKNAIICANPKGAFYTVVKKFWGEHPAPGVGRNSVIHESVKLGKDVSIGCNCVIEEGVVIGDGTVIKHNVVIGKNVQIGKYCKIDSGTVIGTDGFGYSRIKDRYVQVPHLGSVLIGDFVDIGGTTNIERGVLEDTVIEDGVKIDNTCLIGHNCILKKNTMVIGMTVLAGSVVAEEEAYIAPGVTVMNQVHIGKESMVGIGAVAIKDVEDDHVVAGVPAKVMRTKRGNI